MFGRTWWVVLGAVLVAGGCASGGEGTNPTGPSTIGGTESTSVSTGSSTTSTAESGSSPTSDANTSGEATGSGTTSTAECTSGQDCASGFCDQGTCGTVVSCLDLLTKDPMAESGEYEIDPTEFGEPYPVYCDMFTDGGGWTLIMKLTSGTNTLGYDASFWSTEDVLNPGDTMPNIAAAGENAKLPSFNEVTGQAMRLEWVEPTLMGHAFVYNALAGKTALELFSGGEILVAGNESDGCHDGALTDAPGYLADTMRHGQGHQFYGVNGTDSDDGGQNGGLRFGFGSNDEDYNAWGPRQGMGAGGSSLVWGSHDDCNNCGCYGTAFAPRQISANLWVR